MKVALFCSALFAVSFQASAELTEVSDQELSTVRGQASISNTKSLQQLAKSGQQGQVETQAQPLSVTSVQPQSAGITMDIDLQMHIDEIRWVDVDGAGTNGTQGAVVMKGLSVGHLDDMNNPSAAQIRGVTMDVDGRDGLVIGVGQIGDTHGNGIDIVIDSIQTR